MARRIRALRRPAPPASLALGACTLILLVAPAAADSAKRSRSAPVSDPAAPTASPSPSAPAEPAAPSKQAAKAHRHERQAAAAPTPVPVGTAGEPAVARGGRHAATKDASSRAARRAERVAERVAERRARKGGEATGAPAGPETAARAQTPARPLDTGKSHRERERERRRIEREQRREREGHRESRKERLAREAEEARAREAASAAPAGVPVAAVAGVSASVSPPASAAGASGTTSTPAIVHTSSVPPARAKRAHRRVRRTGAGGSALAGGVALAAPVLAAAPSASSAPGPARHAAARHPHRRTPSSPLVTTVTRIIGVIPTALWLLIGALALAAAAFATTSRLAARRARRLAAQRQELLEDVGLLQAALLPELPPRLGLVTTTAAYRPAAGPGAGGDFYDVFALPDGLVAVIVGDVSGHGREALPHTTLLRFTLRAYLEAGLAPREALRSAAPALERQLGGSFATVVLATYDPGERELTYACAGHPHPLLKGLAEDAPIIACSAPPIGAGKPTGTRQTVVSVPGGALACFYTDGVIEARVAGELYGSGRLAEVLDELSGEPSASELLDRVGAGTDRRPDDMAACLLAIDGDGRPPTIKVEELELDGREAGQARVRRFLQAAGVPDREVDPILSSARAIAADHGHALLKIRLGEGQPQVTLSHDNVAPLRARALARTQEVAL